MCSDHTCCICVDLFHSSVATGRRRATVSADLPLVAIVSASLLTSICLLRSTVLPLLAAAAAAALLLFLIPGSLGRAAVWGQGGQQLQKDTIVMKAMERIVDICYNICFAPVSVLQVTWLLGLAGPANDVSGCWLTC